MNLNQRVTVTKSLMFSPNENQNDDTSHKEKSYDNAKDIKIDPYSLRIY